MVGTNRVVNLKDGKTFFEFLRIVVRDGKLYYLASPSGRQPTPFEMTELTNGKVVFENSQHDYPKRITYQRIGETLVAKIEGASGDATEPKQWKWTRSKLSAAPNQKEHGMLKGLRTVVYKVNDLDKAKQWYSDAFGIRPYFDEPFYVGFNVGGYELGLDPDMQGVKYGNGQSIYWGVEDCQKAFDQLITKGGTKVSAPKDVGGGIVVAEVKDPFGNIIGIIKNPHFKLPD